MISSIRIEGYRGFERFEMSGLGRVNLLVGTNNSGKTSVLEAIHLLASAGDPIALWQMLWRRGERLRPTIVTVGDRPVRRGQVELDISHLFFGHGAQLGTAIAITARNHGPERIIRFSIGEMREQQEILIEEGNPLASRLTLEIDGSPKPLSERIPLTRNGGMFSDSIEIPGRPKPFKSRRNIPVVLHNHRIVYWR